MTADEWDCLAFAIRALGFDSLEAVWGKTVEIAILHAKCQERAALRRARELCPVCADSACETRSKECGQ